MSVTVKPRSFAELQYGFTAYIRDPDHAPVPEGVEKRRIDLYRELMFNNVESLLSTSFPVLRRILETSAWNELVQDFFARHRSTTPYFAEIPEEFLEYLQNEHQARKDDYPFLLELAHYEWVELALALAADELPRCRLRTLPLDALQHRYRVSELAWPLAYRFPVHQISSSFKPERPPDQPTYLVVYRSPEDDVRFVEINWATYRLVQILDASREKSAEDCFKVLCTETPGSDPNRLLEYGKDLLQSLWIRGIIFPVN